MSVPVKIYVNKESGLSDEQMKGFLNKSLADSDVLLVKPQKPINGQIELWCNFCGNQLAFMAHVVVDVRLKINEAGEFVYTMHLKDSTKSELPFIDPETDPYESIDPSASLMDYLWAYGADNIPQDDHWIYCANCGEPAVNPETSDQGCMQCEGMGCAVCDVTESRKDAMTMCSSSYVIGTCQMKKDGTCEGCPLRYSRERNKITIEDIIEVSRALSKSITENILEMGGS